jgi:hypothetical protein
VNQDFIEKGKSKYWADREMALKKIKDELINNAEEAISNQEFASNATEQICNCLRENNISLYLVAVDVVGILFSKCLLFNYMYLINRIDSFVTPIALKTSESNTRVRKKSTECLLALWENSFEAINSKFVGLT